MLAAAQLDARGVAAIAHRIGAGAGNAAAHPPKANRHAPRYRHAKPLPSMLGAGVYPRLARYTSARAAAPQCVKFPVYQGKYREI